MSGFIKFSYKQEEQEPKISLTYPEMESFSLINMLRLFIVETLVSSATSVIDAWEGIPYFDGRPPFFHFTTKFTCEANGVGISIKLTALEKI